MNSGSKSQLAPPKVDDLTEINFITCKSILHLVYFFSAKLKLLSAKKNL